MGAKCSADAQSVGVLLGSCRSCGVSSCTAADVFLIYADPLAGVSYKARLCPCTSTRARRRPDVPAGPKGSIMG